MKHSLLSHFLSPLLLVAGFTQAARAQEAAEPAVAAEASASDSNAEEAAPAANSSDTSSSESSTAAPGLFEAASAGTTDTSTPNPLGFKLGGYVRGDAYVGRVIGESGQGEVKAAYGEVALQASAAKESIGDAYADLRLRYGQQDSERRAFLELPEAYVHSKLGFFEVTLGQQILVWGESSQRSGSTIAAPSPIDTLAPISYRKRSPWEADRRQGNLAALVAFDFNPVKLEAVYQPLYQSVDYPLYAPQAGTKAGRDLFPKFALQEGTLAARLHLNLEVFHAAVSFAQGFSGKPGFLPSGIDATDPAQPLLLISRGAYKQQTVGLDLSVRPTDLLRVRAEAAYQNPRTGAAIFVPKAELAYVAGVDLTLTSVEASVQYLGRQVMNFVKAPKVVAPPEQQLAWLNQGLFQQSYAMQHAVSLNLDVFLAERAVSLGAFAFFNLTSGERAINPRVRYHFNERFTLSAGADVYQGPTGSLLGYLSPALTAGYAELKFGF